MPPDSPDHPDREDREHREHREDEAWRAIVENYGERAELGPDEEPGSDDGPEDDERLAARLRERFFDAGPVGEAYDDEVTAADRAAEDEDRYVPPPPPPLPRLAPDRWVAWAGVFGAPGFLLVCLLLSVSLPSWLGYLLVAWFVGGFGYLVWRMPRGPRDPFDDGARL